MNLPEKILPLIADTSLRGGIIILLLLALRSWLRRFFGSAWISLLWLVVLARLLMFWPVESAWSVFNLWPKTQPHAVAESPWKISVSVSGDAVEKVQAVQSAPPVVTSPARQINWLATVWALGAAGMFAYFGLRGLRTARISRRTESANDPRLQKIFASIPNALRGRATLHVTDEVSVPALVGIRRPQIWLPRGWLAALGDEELRHVLLHELGHARRADLAVQWLFALAQCVHWFNPFVWIAARFARADAEMACDAWVLARSAEPERERYGGTLLKTSQLFRARLSISPVAVGMAASGRTLVARVRHVSEYRPVASWRAWLGFAVAAVAAAVLITNQTSAQAPVTAASTPTPASTPAATPVEKANPSSEQPKPFVTLAATASPSSEEPSQQVEIEAKFFEVTETVAKKLGIMQIVPTHENAKDKKSLPVERILFTNSILDQQTMDELLKKLNEAKGVDLLSAPRVITKDGKKAVVEIVRVFHYPTEFDLDKTSGKLTPSAFETRNLGVTLEVKPEILPNQIINLTLAPEATELEGFITSSEGQPVPLRDGKGVVAHMKLKDVEGGLRQPVFSSRKMTTMVSVASGKTILLGGLNRKEQLEGGEPVTRIMFILITARQVDVYGKILLNPPPITSTPAPAPPNSDLPAAITQPGDKPGFVRSPYKSHDLIDVRGFPAGTEVKDPYSGKIFLVPNLAPNPTASDSPASFKVTILGEVNKPGVYTMDAGLSLASIIAEAQGFTKIANQKKITVIAKDGSKTIVDFKANPVFYILKPGDVISVGESIF